MLFCYWKIVLNYSTEVVRKTKRKHEEVMVSKKE